MTLFNVTAKFLPTFPSKVTSTGFLTVSKTGATYTFGANFQALSEITSVPDLADVIVALQNISSGSFTKIKLSNLPVGSIAWGSVTDKPSTFAPSAHTHTASEISDSTAAGRGILTAGDAAAQRALMSAQTLNGGLTSLAGASGTNTIYYRSAADTWSPITIGSQLNFASGTLDYREGLILTEASFGAAATTAIGTTNNERVVITGTATITSLGTNANRNRLVRFTGTPTLTHNATSLILPTGANIVVEAGDTAQFTSDASGNWRCIWYQRANGAALSGVSFTGVSGDDGKIIYYDHATTSLKPAWASPKNPEIDLRDLMDAEYGAGAWTPRTGINAGSDIAPALERGFDLLRTRYSAGTIIIPTPVGGGAWIMKRACDANKMAGHNLRGIHNLYSQIVFSGTGDCFRANGDGGYTGGSWSKIALYREDGYSSSSTALRCEGGASFQGDQMTIDDFYISALGTGYWTYNFVCQGTARTSPQGQRVLSARNLQLFRSGAGGGYSVLIHNVVQGDIRNIGTYVGTGALANNVYIGGGGTSSTNTTQLDVSLLACGGELNLTNSTSVNLSGQASTVAMATTAAQYNGVIWATSSSGAIGLRSTFIIL
jgi:hypothetical protein